MDLQGKEITPTDNYALKTTNFIENLDKESQKRRFKHKNKQVNKLYFFSSDTIHRSGTRVTTPYIPTRSWELL